MKKIVASIFMTVLIISPLFTISINEINSDNNNDISIYSDNDDIGDVNYK